MYIKTHRHVERERQTDREGMNMKKGRLLVKIREKF